LLDFARNYLGLDYIFWVEDEPYFSNEVLKSCRRIDAPARRHAPCHTVMVASYAGVTVASFESF